jgi:hypothetical protein
VVTISITDVRTVPEDANGNASCCSYNIVFMILTYFLPICSMSFTYARVGLELWGSQSIGECTQRQLENIKSKRRVSPTLQLLAA